MADGSTLNGSHQEANGEMSSLTMKDLSLDRPLGVKKGTEGYGGSYSNTRTTRRKFSTVHPCQNYVDQQYEMTGSNMHSTMDTDSETRVSFSKDQQITVLHETVISTWSKFVAEFDQVDEHLIESMTVEGFWEYIERQRLTYMPHRGSRWDKVLKLAEFFGLQVSGYAKAFGSFVPESEAAAKLMWAASHTLLEVSRIPLLYR